jgi:acyl-coenzyme A thioesterase PaaI-like protein
MSASNPLRKFVEKVNRYPAPISAFLMTKVFRHKVKLAGTTSIDVVSTNGQQVEYRMRNRKKVQNHIGSVHAAAMALLAESATGFIVGINLPGDKLPLIKCMNLNYVKRATGNMKAIAVLTDEQVTLLNEREKGEINVQVKVTDETGIEPVVCEMIWAWVPKRS